MFALVLRTVIFYVCAVFSAVKPLQILQQTSYRANEYFCTLKRQTVYLSVSLVFILFALLMLFIGVFYLCVLGVAFSIFSALISYKKSKKPLILTKRVWRLIAVYFFITLLLGVLQIVCVYLYPLAFCSIALVVCANYLCLPLERQIAKGFIKRAEKKLKRIKPKVIAITGSYGKTSLKNVLTHILKTQYKVCSSPKSYNTPMGLARCINENLADDDQIFIAEAGARYKGDIGEICRFIHPEVAIITAVGNQHLATFKTVEELRKEKFSIANGVETVFINGDNVSPPYHHLGQSLIVCGQNGTVKYSDAVVSKQSQSFYYNGKNSFKLTCPLLADYVPSMLTLAVAVAQNFSISQKNIKNSIKTLKPIAHRLEILYNDKDVIIDDAYNSNEKGFISAVNLLAKFENKIKVLITPGVVELGKEQEQINCKLAYYAYERVDFVFTYGVNATAIKRGAGEKCQVCSSLDECMKRYKSIKGERAVLFENDLPDTY